MENNPSQAATGSIDICNEFEQSTVDQSSDNDTFPLDSGTSKIGQSSITQTPQHATPSTSTRKRSVRKLSISIPDELPLNDDESELINEDATAKMKGQEETPQSCNDTGPVRMIATMEQMQEHMSRCLELSTENKINTKNAFGLKLIDYMSIMTKGGEQNFTTMACQLDAGAKIYANRVDAVHNLTLKLAETCFFAERQTSNQTPKEDDEMNVTVDGIEAGTSGTTEKVKKKKSKKSVIATAEQITRKIKGKDPRERFVKLEARPGDILTKAKRDPKDLSLTLDKHVPFWMDWQKYTPTKATGTCEVPTICNENREFGSSQDSAISEPSVSDLLSGLHLDDQDSDAEPDSPVDFDNEDNNTPTIVDSSLVEKPKCGESEAVLCAGREVIKENADAFNFEALKTALHESGDNEYNYLKTDVSHFRTGPNFQKCFPGLKCAANKKKGIRKKKELCDINYEKLPANRNIVKTKKRRTVLAKSTIINWSKKNFTLYSDFDMNIRPLCTLFHMDIAAIIVRDPPEQDKMDSNPEILAALDTEPDVDPSDEHNTSGNDHNSQCDDNNAQANNNEDEFEAQVDFSLPLGSNQEFGVFPSSSSDDPYSGELPTASSPASNDAFEGDNLVPMVKMVKVDPIRCVAKPNRVDMQHLKTIMLNIILQDMDGDNENQHPSEGNVAGRQSVWFKDVIYKLFNTDVLHYRTRRDLSVAMAYLALLTLASENEFMLENRDGDVMISHYQSGQVPCNPETENQGTMD